MIKRILLENFMAHKRTELCLGPGVNALTGPNNTGKSALVEALRCVATNPVPKHYIRHGAKKAQVTVELDDGTHVIWIRKKQSSGYEILRPGAEKAEKYWKFGRKPPPQVLDALRLNLVELESGDPLDVHIGNQRQPIFLLNQPGSNAAAFFAASTESAHLLAMQNVLKRRMQEAKRQEKDLKRRLVSVQAEMETLSPLPDIAVALEQAKKLESTTKQYDVLLPALEKSIQVRVKAERSLREKSEQNRCLAQAVAPQKLNNTKELSHLIKTIMQADNARMKSSRVDAALGTLSEPPKGYDSGRIAILCEELQLVSHRLQKAQKRASGTAQLDVPPTLTNVTYLSDIISQMRYIAAEAKSVESQDRVLRTIAAPPLLESDARLEGVVSEMSRLESALKEAQASQDTLEIELLSLKKIIEKRVEAAGICPTCGGDFNTEAFLDRRHVHDS